MLDHALDVYGIAYHNPYKVAWLACGLVLSLAKMATAWRVRRRLGLFLVASAVGVARGTRAWSLPIEVLTSSVAFLAAAAEIARLSQKPYVRRPLLVGAGAFASCFALAVLAQLPRYAGYPDPLYGWRLYPAAACWGGCLGVVVLQVGSPAAARIRIALLGLWMGAVVYAGIETPSNVEQWFRINFEMMALESACLYGWWWTARDQLFQSGKLSP